jgi:eukaryotic-like serine/threonine-protein kinase
MPRMPADRLLPPSLLLLLQGLLTKQCLDRLADPANVRHLLKLATIEDLRGIRALPPDTPKYTIVHSPLPPAPVAKKRNVTFVALLLLLISAAVFFSWTTLVRSNEAAGDPLTQTSEKPPLVVEAKHAIPTGAKHSSLIYPKHIPEEITIPEEMPAEIVPIPGPGIPLVNGIYFNDFSDQQDTLWDTGKDDNSEYNLKDGKYTMKGLADSLSYSTSVKFDLNPQKDFTITASATHWGEAASDPFGINFCGDQEQDAYFVFYITSNGYYSIGALIKDEWNVLVDWTASSNIRPDAEMNILSIEKQNGALRFFINDKLEKTMPFTGGFGSFFGMRVDGAQAVSFDQFIVKGSQ